MKVTLYRPKSPLLRHYIECFYTLQCEPEDKSTTYVAFPSIFSMVCLNANSKIELAESNLTFTYCPNTVLETTLFCNFDSSGWIRYEGQADEIVIYFKPLGINSFLENTLKHYVRSFFVKFEPFEDYRSKMTGLFSLDNDADKMRALENYWLSKYKGFEHPFLHQVVEELLNEHTSTSLSELAFKNGISRTTLNKHFDLHVCTTPSQFRKVARFRNAITRHRNRVYGENLADISCDVNYFDQSHMIKDFKLLTKYSPKIFFTRISNLEGGQINWLFI